MKNKVTALIVTYRRPEFLKRAIRSVINQSYTNIQISVFDDASGDETKSIVECFSNKDERVSYHCHTENIGQFANFRYAFESVKTPYFSILSDDDCISMDLYKNALQVLDNNPEVMFVILNTLMIDENSNLKSHVESTGKLSFHEGLQGFDDFHSGQIPVTWTAMVFRKELSAVYRDMDEKYDFGHDIRFLVNAASKYKYAYLSKVGAFFTQHPQCSSLNIKRVDLVHQSVQISRYVEIFHDKSVKKDIKDRSIFYIKKLLDQKPNITQSLKEIIKNFIVYNDLNDKLIIENISDYKKAGYPKTSQILNILYKNKLAKFLVNIFFGWLFKRKILQNQLAMHKLQNEKYRKHFEYIKKN